MSLMKAIIPDYCRERERERKKEKERTCEAIGFEQVLIGNSHMIIAPSRKGCGALQRVTRCLSKKVPQIFPKVA